MLSSGVCEADGCGAGVALTIPGPACPEGACGAPVVSPASGAPGDGPGLLSPSPGDEVDGTCAPSPAGESEGGSGHNKPATAAAATIGTASPATQAAGRRRGRCFYLVELA